MENSIFLAISRQSVLMNNMDTVANNIANMNTSGFRAQNLMFEEFIADPRKTDDPLSFVYDRRQYQTTDPGPLKQTGNSLNVALNGPGFLAVEAADGEVGYTRDGNFLLSGDGTLTNQSGYPILGDGGPIVIPQNSVEISIDERGFISDSAGIIARLQVVEFENPQELEPFGDNTYITAGATLPPNNTTVQQGFLEGSNVNPIKEITNMIEVLRSFQSTQNVLDQEHERLRSAIEALTQV
ncbi:MAG: flagellar basal-body rod protein FlgF [Alphaproteobacteria bacterium]|nr:flagellar basal-body rod protein FlgF [Alphaproteobacteria bacterium]